MELRELGRTVGFGGSPLGNVFGDVSEEEPKASVRLAFQSGINFFDTSPYYGGTLSEKVLEKALKALGAPRNSYVVATKCGRYKEGFDFSAERVTRSIEESLQRLQLDYVDILQCHDIEFGSLDQVVLSYCHYCVNDTSLGDLKAKGVGIINASPLSMGLLNGILPRRNSSKGQGAYFSVLLKQATV
ncbi:hypothetical protein JHK85_019571 [Glycine max]|nr:hypothetical protein JHK85_019571 [Glycine max]